MMYEVLIKLINEMDYHKYTIEELQQIKEILKPYEGKTEEIKAKRLEKGKRK